MKDLALRSLARLEMTVFKLSLTYRRDWIGYRTVGSDI